MGVEGAIRDESKTFNFTCGVAAGQSFSKKDGYAWRDESKNELCYRIKALTKSKEFTASLSQDSFTYNGQSQIPEHSAVKLGKATLTEGTDYTVTTPAPEDSVVAGTYTVKITGLRDYGDLKKNLTYKINKATPAVSIACGGFIYDGGTKGNAITSVTGLNGQKWELNKDYTQGGTFAANMPGTYSMTVTPKDTDNFNTVTKSYSIGVQPTAIKKLSRARKAFTVKVYKRPKNLVNGYQVLYSLNSNMAGAKCKTIGTKYKKTSKKIRSLKKKRTYFVQVRTYKTIGKTKYYSGWSGVSAVTTK